MKIYIHPQDFRCFADPPDGAYLEAETDFFDGMCAAFIQGYRFVPAGHTWTRGDGARFRGTMIVPWKEHAQLDAAQRAYEREQYQAAHTAWAALKEGLAAV